MTTELIECPVSDAIVHAMRHAPIPEYLAAMQAHDAECAVCGAEDEPECECSYIDVDIVDASGCELHGFRRAA